MIDKKLLLEVSALKLAGKIEKLNDEQLNQYEQLLVSFIEGFPESEQKIKAALETKDKESIASNLEEICAILEKIQASELASECRELINALKNFDYEHEKIEAFVTVFLGSAAMLSIDIQMAKYLEKKTQTAFIEKKKDDVASKKPGEKTILAVDDAAISLTMLKKSLQGEPNKLTCINSGESALQFLKSNDPDLFILDIEMPKMNGYELAEKIRENGHEAPIIFLTGNATKRYLMRAIQAGASDFIVKPIDKKYLTYKINKHLFLQNA
jgi:CheY-like chemotaxis protein/HPt (histidine-containing phosphotransfer) domain-containing protein